MRLLHFRWCLLFCLCAGAKAHDAVYLPAVDVQGRATSLHGTAMSASQGYVGKADIEALAVDRAGDLLETVPGMVATQHSGSGKANQYFMRGFNLDHGTDFAAFVDGMPVNMPSHGHGQGYADMNFLIPEFVSMVSYLKGPYYAMVGDFASAGSASIALVDVLPEDFATVGVAEYGQFRVAGGQGYELDQGDLLAGVEFERNDGPWELDEELRKTNALLRYSRGSYEKRFSLTAMAYGSSWNATDQIPSRAVESGTLSPLGVVDDTVGGRSSRYSLSARWRSDVEHARTSINLYTIYYDVNLWSNFTYFLEDPVNGDQFEQADRRQVYGLDVSRTLFYDEVLGKTVDHSVALQARWDVIDQLGLYHTKARERIGKVREDSVDTLALGVAYEAKVDWSSRLRSHFGVRLDRMGLEVRSDRAANSGSAEDYQASPKASLVFTPSAKWEGYASAGRGFHSNDARGTTIAVDPQDGVTPVAPVDPIGSSYGFELGGRYSPSESLNTSVAFWSLDMESELVYVGDAGGTEVSGASKRSGIEWTTFYAFSDMVSLDVDVALSDATFEDGGFVPGAIKRKIGGGLSYRGENGWSASARYRHFGGRPLVEDGSARSASSTSVDLRLGFSRDRWQATLELINAFDSRDHDITYHYASRLPGEAANGVEDLHYHIMKPRALRASFRWAF